MKIIRWTVRRKAAVLQAIADGRITPEAACARWELTREEIEAWRRDFASAGVRGLRATRHRHHDTSSKTGRGVSRRPNPGASDKESMSARW